MKKKFEIKPPKGKYKKPVKLIKKYPNESIHSIHIETTFAGGPSFYKFMIENGVKDEVAIGLIDMISDWEHELASKAYQLGLQYGRHLEEKIGAVVKGLKKHEELFSNLDSLQDIILRASD